MQPPFKIVKQYLPLEISAEEELLISKIASCAQRMKLQAFVIGGNVRDQLLHRGSKDIDITVVGNGIEFAQAVSKAFGRENDLVIYKNFGTALLKHNDLNIEFVGARKESYRSESRNPVVENGTLDDDLQRRDFTINTLAISLNHDDYGMVIDAFDGLKDLRQKIIRTPLDPDITFSDDPLRMMRAIRFAAQLNFRIEPAVFQSISKNRERIQIISGERIADELNKIILSPTPSIGFDLLFKSGLLKIIFPEFEKLYGVEHLEGQGHKDNFYHTLQVLDHVAAKSDDLWLRWSAILHDIAKPETKRFEKGKGWTFHGHEVVGARRVQRVFRKFHLPLNQHMKFVEKMVFLHLRPIVLSKEEVTDSAIRRLLFEAGDDIDKLMVLSESDITSKNEKKVKRYLENFQLVREKLKEVEEKDKLRNWQPPITGELIMETFGKPPSKEIGTIKDAIREAILDGKIENNYEAAYQYMIQKGAEAGWIPQTKK